MASMPSSADAGLVLVQLAALKVGLAGGLGLIGLNVAPSS